MTNLNIALLKNLFGKVIMDAFEHPYVSEIIVNGDGSIWLEGRDYHFHLDGDDYYPEMNRQGKCHSDDLLHAFGLLAEYRGVYLNQTHPDMCIALPSEAPFDGARLKALIPPIVKAPCMTIRKHLKRDGLSLASYREKKILSEAGFNYLTGAIQAKKNIVVSGQPKSGKTTLTLALLAEIAKYDDRGTRILVIENTPELWVGMGNVEYMMTSTTREMNHLVENAMSMRPDRIIVGEVTDKAALAMLKAWNTGCPGGISTLHANSNKATCQRLIDLSMENNVPAPIGLITEAVDVLVHIKRDSKGGRKVTEISKLEGFDETKNQFNLTEILKEKKE